MRIVSVLKNIFLFSELNDTELHIVASVSTIRKLKKGHVLFYEGDTATNFYAIAHGSLKVLKINENGTENILHIQQDGDLIAEAVLFGIKKYPASCVAIKDSTVISISRSGFTELILNNPRLSIKFMSAYSSRLREFVNKIDELSSTVEKRLMNYLMDNSKELLNGKRICELTISKKDLAALLNTSPETLSRTFTYCAKKGYISFESKKRVVVRTI